jgi:hypothetical protein
MPPASVMRKAAKVRSLFGLSSELQFKLGGSCRVVRTLSAHARRGSLATTDEADSSTLLHTALLWFV